MKFASRIIQIGLIIALLVSTAYCIWILDRGFNIIDESYYLLNAIYPDNFQLGYTHARLFSSLLWAITGSFVLFRASGLIVLLSGSLILALGTIYASPLCGMPVAGRPWNRAAIISCTIVCALLYGSVLNFTPSYNLLATSFAYAAMGLAMLSFNRTVSWHALALKLMSGCLVGAVFLCKFPAGIMVFCLVSMLIVAFDRTLRDRMLGIFICLVGMVVVILIIIRVQGPFADTLEKLRLGMAINKFVSPSVGHLLSWYFNDLMGKLIMFIKFFALPTIFFIVFACWRRTIIAIMGIGLLIYTLIFGGHLVGGIGRNLTTQMISLATSLLLCLLVTLPTLLKNRNIRILSIVFFFLPFCVAVGTSALLSRHILLSLASWGTLIALLAFAGNLEGRKPLPAMLICAIFITTAVSQTMTSGFQLFYRLYRPISEQTELTKVGAIGSVKLDKKTQDFVFALTDLAEKCGITPGEPFLGYYDIPGIAIITQTVPVLTPWLFNPKQAKAILDHADPETIHSAVVGMRKPQNENTPSLPGQMNPFPKGYRSCGTVTFPYREQQIQIWAPE